MELLDQVMSLKQQGKSDMEIASELQKSGISASNIQGAISQANVKNAVSPPESSKTTPTENSPTSNMQPSMMSLDTPPQNQPESNIPNQTQIPEPIPSTPDPAAQMQVSQFQAPEQEYYTPQPTSYPEQNYYQDTSGYGTETISEIAEQVATEKIKDYQSKVGDMASFKIQIQNKVNDIDDRLKRMENSIDKLQQAILGKIGEFGESSAMIHQDLNNLHGTVSKLMNPLVDNIKEMKKLSKK